MSKLIGLKYLERGQPVTVLAELPANGRIRTVEVLRKDGSIATRPLLGLRITERERHLCRCGCELAPSSREAEYVRGHRPPSPESSYMQCCRISDCNTLIGMRGARGLCTRHYQKLLITGDPLGASNPPIERFSSFLAASGDCWHWTGSIDGAGYGMFSDRATSRWLYRAHRWSYRYFIADVPDGLELDHLCHNRDLDCAGGVTCLHRRCANPWHLEPVPGAVNANRGIRSRIVSCPSGHPYDQMNTYINPSNGSRVCRTCMQAHRARYKDRKKAA